MSVLNFEFLTMTDPFSLAVNLNVRPPADQPHWQHLGNQDTHTYLFLLFFFHSILPFHSSIAILPFRSPLSPLPKNTTRTGKNQPKTHSMKLKRFLLRYYPPGTCNCHTGTPYVPMRCSFACNPLTTSID